MTDHNRTTQNGFCAIRLLLCIPFVRTGGAWHLRAHTAASTTMVVLAGWVLLVAWAVFAPIRLERIIMHVRRTLPHFVLFRPPLGVEKAQNGAGVKTAVPYILKIF